MKPPRIPPMLTMIVQTGVLAADGVLFTDYTACPECGGSLAGYDTKKKRFAVVRNGEEEQTISVFVRRFRCRSCYRLTYADEPFYPGTRIGSPVIDLCIALSMTMPVNRIAAYLAAMGVVVDRTSCRLYIRNSRSNYIRNNARYIGTSTLFGIHLPRSIISLSALASGNTGTSIPGNEILAACGFPSARQAPLHLSFPRDTWEDWRRGDREPGTLP